MPGLLCIALVNWKSSERFRNWRKECNSIIQFTRILMCFASCQTETMLHGIFEMGEDKGTVGSDDVQCNVITLVLIFFADVLGIALWRTSIIRHGVVAMMMNRGFHCFDATAATGGVDIKWIFDIFELFIPTSEAFLSARWCLPFPPFVSLNSKKPLMDVSIVVTNSANPLANKTRRQSVFPLATLLAKRYRFENTLEANHF